MKITQKKRYWLGPENQNIHHLKYEYVYNDAIVRDHLIYGEQVLMGVAHLSLAITLASKINPRNTVTLNRVSFSYAVMLKSGESCEVAIKLESINGKDYLNSYCSIFPHTVNKEAATHQLESSSPWKAETLPIHEMIQQSQHARAGRDFYQDPIQECYGPSLLSVKQVYDLSDGNVLGEIILTPEMIQYCKDYYVHPAIFDACHVISSYCFGAEPAHHHRVPLMIKNVMVSPFIQPDQLSHCFCLVEKIMVNNQIAEVNMKLLDDKGNLLVILNGFVTKVVPSREALFSDTNPPTTTKNSSTSEKIELKDSLEMTIQEYLRVKIAIALNKNKQEIGITASFMDLGLDSNNMIGAVREIEEQISIELYPTLFFEHQNIKSLSNYFSKENSREFSVYFNLNLSDQSEEKNISKEKSNLYLEESDKSDDIAIIGMSGYLPQSKNLDDFWNHLKLSHDLIQEVPHDRWDMNEWFNEDKTRDNKTYSKWGGFITDVDKFDYSFFGISKRQAIWMDPQLRLMLQSVQETLEDAGAINSIIGSKTGVYVGSCFHEYWDEIVRAETTFVDYQAHSAAMSSLSGMISYYFDLQGASIPLDNACASSLTALHLGCQAIKQGECDQAIIAGSNVLLSPLHYVYFSRLQALSPTGRCHTFDKKADGYVPGEGIVSVLLKPLNKAIKDGDNIHAIIKGTAINHVGRSNNPYSPRPELQTQLLIEAWQKSGISPREISYIEAHGTGTKLGDPIEVNALKNAFKSFTSDTGFCAIGSAKAHIGHLEGAAGLASLVKVILMMKHKTIPKMPNFSEVNSYIKLESSPFYINTETMDWKTDANQLRMAGVSSFGMTGNNAHVIVQEYIAPEPVTSHNNELIAISARNQQQLLASVDNLLKFIQEKDDALNIANISHTLIHGRKAMHHRFMLVVKNKMDLTEKLHQISKGESEIPGVYRGVITEETIYPHFQSVDDYEKKIRMCYEKNELEKLAELWVQGVPLKSKNNYLGTSNKIMSMPTYPFASERCWKPMDEFTQMNSTSTTKNTGKLHPLIHKNISSDDIIRFQSKFDGDEFFLLDHRVGLEKILPGVAYLEMAYFSFESLHKQISQLTDIVWMRPLVVDVSCKTILTTLKKNNGSYQFMMTSDEDQNIIYCQGNILDTQLNPKAPISRSITEIKNRCTTRMNSMDVYRRFADNGLNYGESFQAITDLYFNESESFAAIILPKNRFSDASQFKLHPSILDAALQSVIGLSDINENTSTSKTYLPFLIKSLTIYKEVDRNQTFAYARLVDGTVKGSEILKCDIEILDSNGDICILIQGFTAKLLPGKITQSSSTRKLENSTTLNTDTHQSIEAFLIDTVCKILRVNAEFIYLDEEMSAYGLDSITLTELANETNQKYKLELFPTVFFEYPTLAAFRDYIAEKISNIPKTSMIEKNDVKNNIKNNDIAIIGISGKFPMSDTLDEFWENLEQGKDCISEIPANRWNWQTIFGDPKEEENKTNIKWGGFINGIDQFDPLHFGISPVEAEMMDPQQRLLLEFTWRAIEDAGYEPRSLSGSATGVFIGTASTGYHHRVLHGHSSIEGYSSMAAVPCIGPNRVSYFLNLHGPSEPIETACSSALVAIHRGVNAILQGEIDQAIVGGINTLLSPEVHISFSKAGMLSIDGKCKTFSEDANGYVRSEGIGIILIKRLDQAIQDNDRIYAIIKSSSMNHGGRSNSLTAPNANAQADLLINAYKKANIDVSTIGYIEAHGTGTALGDPVEINGLKKAFSTLYAEQNITHVNKHCGLGSVKSNIGHAELAAGIAGVIKVLLAMKHGIIPSTLHSQKINPYIQLDDSPFYIAEKKQDWQRLPDQNNLIQPRRAGVSSFGFGGVNAHIVLEEYIPENDHRTKRLPLAPHSFNYQSYWIKTDSSLSNENINMVANSKSNMIYATTHWEIAPISDHKNVNLPESVSLLGFLDLDVDQIKNEININLEIQPKKPFIESFKYCFDIIKNIIHSKPKSKQHLLFVVTDDPEMECHYAAIATLIKTAQMENPIIRGKVVYISHPQDLSFIINQEKWFNDTDIEIRYKNKLEREVKKVQEVNINKTNSTSIIDGGVYWITGGLGGLGNIFAEHLSKSKNIILILTGRSVLTADKEKVLQDYKQKGISIYYIQGDVSLEEDVERVFLYIKNKYGKLNGIIHSAGVINDAFILKKTHDQIDRVLAPKIKGVMNLDRITQSEHLDFFVIFSSITGSFGSIGQADYSAANAYLDSYSYYRNTLVKQGIRQGKTLSIAWPLWSEGGMQIDAATTASMTRLTGLVPMETSNGIQAFDWALSSDSSMMIIMQGDVALIRKKFSITQAEKKAVFDVKSSLIQYLKTKLANHLKLTVNQIDEKTDLEKYGMDSVMIISINNALEKIFGTLPKTLFFEYQTLESLADFFINHHYMKINEILKQDNKTTNSPLAIMGENKIIKQTVVKKINEFVSPQFDDIAIIGVSGRYPQAENLELYWENLKNGRNCITEIPSSRWNHQPYIKCKWGGFIEGVDEFDPLFFNISPREAELMDPQERLFLQCAWSALEDSGYTREKLSDEKIANQVGVYVGVMYEEYQLHGAAETLAGNVIGLTGNPASIANRVSYICNLNGPSMAIDTMCSSSLTTIHLACESLRSGQIKMALAGGVNISIHPNKYIMLGNANFISEKGRCESFGKGGEGYVPGEGVGCVVLKPLAQAIADHDFIYGVIKGTAINHGGKTNGYTVPNPKSQTAVIKRALEAANVDPRTISYVEAHGTGTSLGDPIEISGLTQAYQSASADKQYCAIGSVKSNIGHCESAAGIASITKVLLQLKHKMLVPSIHSNELNPNIDFMQTPFKVQQTLSEWIKPVIAGKEYPRIASISSFGAGGSNAHIILEEYINDEVKLIDTYDQQLILLSAKTEEQLHIYVKSFIEFIRSSDQKLSDIAYTLQQGREALEFRLAIIVESKEALLNYFNDFISGQSENHTSFYCNNIARTHDYAILMKTDHEFQKSLLDDIKQANLPKIADSWAKGIVINWKYFPHSSQKIIPLPTYPFAKEKYWITQSTKQNSLEKTEFKIDQNAIEDPSEIDNSYLKSKFIDYLKDKLSGILKLHPDKISERALLEIYGIDSVMILELNNELEIHFGELPKTLFFEYQTLNDLANYFIDEHQHKIITLLGITPVFKKPNKSIKNTENVMLKDHYNEIKPSQDIAIIGIYGRYPKANNLDEFWENLKIGRDCITEIPETRWDKIPSIQCKWGGFIDGVDEFDPLFFNISPRDAEIMDPQERLFLQCAWSALEDSGYTRERLSQEDIAGKVGVYAGVMYEEYQLYGVEQTQAGHMIGLAGNPASIANRVSYVCDFHGPSMAIDTMCSSSLTTIHLACESLRAGKIKMAIAGGVNISIHPNKYILLNSANFISSQGRCESFGKGGDGYVPGEGVGCVILKPLSQAVKDHDQIYGVIKATAINHGGKTNGYTVPNPLAQADVIQDALKEANIHPRTISYIETHGTGTVLGDPIEINGLARAFQGYTNDKQYCAIGSVKSNIGHCESAAGIASITKVLLQLKHGKLVPSLHSNELNPNINFSQTPFKVQQEFSDWHRPQFNGKEFPRIAGISSFGAGGSNAHIIIEEFISDESKIINHSNAPELFIVSAKSENQLYSQLNNLLNFLEITDQSFSDIAYTLQTGREAMKIRFAFIAEDKQAAIDLLKKQLQKNDNFDRRIYKGTSSENNDSIALFSSDTDLIEVIRKWLHTGVIDKLASLWVKGVNFNWNEMHIGLNKKRISLPTYPFCKERYWISKSQTQPVVKKTQDIESIDWLSSIRKYQNKTILIVHHSDLYEKAILLFKNKINSIIEKSKNTDELDIYSINLQTNINIDIKPDIIMLINPLKSMKNKLTNLFEEFQTISNIECYISLEDSEWTLDDFNGWISNIGFKNNFYGFNVANVQHHFDAIVLLFKHWLTAEKSSIRNPETRNNTVSSAETRSLIHFIEKKWQVKNIHNHNHPILNGNCLVMLNSEITTPLVERNQLSQLFTGITHFISDVNELDTYSANALATEKIKQMGKISCIIDLSEWSMNPQHEDKNKLSKIVFLQQIIATFNPITILYVTQGLQHLNGSLTLSGSKIAGLIKMLSFEYDHVVAKHIDIDNEAHLVDLLVNELCTPLEETEIVYKSNKRYVPLLEAIPSMQPTIPYEIEKQFPIKSNGIYIITGGTNGIGLELANYLANRGAKNLLLMGVTKLPEQSEWLSSINDANTPLYLKEKLKRLQALSTRDVNLLIYTGPLTDIHAINDYINKLTLTIGPVYGVIHSAANMQALRESEVAFIKKDTNQIVQVIEPKVNGIENLHSMLNGQPLDFFVSFSSTAGQFPKFMRGMSDYAIANSYIDYFSQYQFNQRNMAYRSIAWVGWKEIGSHDEDTLFAETQANNVGLLFNDIEDGIRLFEAAMVSKNSHVNFLPAFIDKKIFDSEQKSIYQIPKRINLTYEKNSIVNDIIDLINNGKKGEAESLFSKLDLTDLSDNQIEELSTMILPPINSEDEDLAKQTSVLKEINVNDLNHHLSLELAKILKVDITKINHDDNFQDYGLDSISGTQLSIAIERLVHLTIPTKWLIEYPTINLLSNKIKNEMTVAA